MDFRPSIAPEIFELRPDYMALSICMDGVTNTASNEASCAMLLSAAGGPRVPWAEGHINAWREAYRSFGAKPQRTPCSVEALSKRYDRDGQVPGVNAVVDLYNALSLRFAVPVGGEDAIAYEGPPRLIRATGDELFDTVSEGQPRQEAVETGEVIWCDNRAVTCRRWNWRQSTRTRITEASTSLWFVLDRLEPMPVDALVEAGRELVAGLSRMTSAAPAKMILFTSAQPAGHPVA
jgi:DNA/RNA-binding domain of Phe-tRNA-synthetase-like protein